MNAVISSVNHAPFSTVWQRTPRDGPVDFSYMRLLRDWSLRRCLEATEWWLSYPLGGDTSFDRIAFNARTADKNVTDDKTDSNE